MVLPCKDEPGKWDIANEEGIRWSVGMRERPTVSFEKSAPGCLEATLATVGGAIILVLVILWILAGIQ